MSSASQFGTQLAKATERAKKKYPNQPERARKMADGEMGYYNGPYMLEPMTLIQRITHLFMWDDHATDFSDVPITASRWQWFKRTLTFIFTGI